MATLQPVQTPAQQEAQAEVNSIVQEDAAKNRVAVHTFDPDASPQEKAATAGKNRDQLKSVTDKPSETGVKGMWSRLLI